MENSTYILKGEELTVTIRRPESCTGMRFDRTGWITQVVLNQPGISFCVPESLIEGQGTGGEGLSGEFGIDKPVGYQEAAIGDTFVKLGIGALTKIQEEGYNFAGTYPLQAYEVQTEVGHSEITFTVNTPEHNGYAATLVKHIMVEGRSIHMTYRLENEGQKKISTNEYVHNFVAVNQHAVGADYVLKLPYAPKLKMIGDGGVEKKLESSPDQLTWNEDAGGEYYALYEGFEGGEAPYWELLHTPSGAGMRESGDFDVSKFAVWGSGHVIAPEVFIDLELEAGESRTWTRTYTFFA
ncbi:hypothetical protein [Saccharibacillus sp. JS10]|uniref:hypothetical protein n=1 Tax=Saccharibacillus sp. JS10 TaxID=2950552 RepID=UPI0021093A1F|nr:hypothetical protein [Saccharibacillus sp. JS10]MCQ4086334.1 hypothetical protein [Saccharibacillus sp. JS10]